MLIYNAAALGAAFCWALAGIVSSRPARYLGAMRFNTMKLVSVSLVLSVIVVLSGSWKAASWSDTTLLILSGMVGIFAGDTILYGVLNRVGPRRAGVLFALNAPMAAILSWIVLGETISRLALVGMALATGGVVVAIIYGKRSGQHHAWEAVQGPFPIAIVLGLAAALAQAVGLLLARPAMLSGVDPVLGSLLRVGVSALCLSAIVQLPIRNKSTVRLTWKVLAMTALSGVLSMVLGMTLLMFALSGGDVGTISTISATSPVLVLPMIWMVTRERPALGAWVGAGAVISGMALIFSS